MLLFAFLRNPRSGSENLGDYVHSARKDGLNLRNSVDDSVRRGIAALSLRLVQLRMQLLKLRIVGRTVTIADLPRLVRQHNQSIAQDKETLAVPLEVVIDKASEFLNMGQKHPKDLSMLVREVFQVLNLTAEFVNDVLAHEYSSLVGGGHDDSTPSCSGCTCHATKEEPTTEGPAADGGCPMIDDKTSPLAASACGCSPSQGGCYSAAKAEIKRPASVVFHRIVADRVIFNRQIGAQHQSQGAVVAHGDDLVADGFPTVQVLGEFGRGTSDVDGVDSDCAGSISQKLCGISQPGHYSIFKHDSSSLVGGGHDDSTPSCSGCTCHTTKEEPTTEDAAANGGCGGLDGKEVF